MNIKSTKKIGIFMGIFVVVIFLFPFLMDRVYSKETDTCQIYIPSPIKVEIPVEQKEQNTINKLSIQEPIIEYEYVCPNPDCDNLEKGKTNCYSCMYYYWDEELKQYSKGLSEQTKVPYEYILATIWNESKFTSDAYSNGNYGLMQINSVTLDFLNREIGVNSTSELLDPKTNILAGVTILKYHMDSVDNYADMVMRYQCGEGTFAKLKSQGVDSIETSRRTVDIANKYKELLEVL